MTALHALAIFAAGMAAGTINVAVGSGTLVTFPVLLAFGYPPVVANVSNTIGLVPAAASGAIGYRRELGGQRRRFGRLAVASTAGGLAGALLLLELPASAFRAIVPGFIGIAVALILLQPLLRPKHAGARGGTARSLGALGILLSGVYGGYFGAAQGILVLSILGLVIDDRLQRINALKVLLVGLVNLVAGIVFAFAAHVSWDAAGLIAAGSILGGVLGARAGRRLPEPVLRGVIVAVGVLAIVQLV